MGGLSDLGYTTPKGRPEDPSKKPRETPQEGAQRGGLSSLGYQTGITRQEVRADLEGREGHPRYPAFESPERRGEKPGFSMRPVPVPANEVTKEKNLRILESRYSPKNFDRSTAYNNFPVTFDLSRSDTFKEKRDKFKHYFPQGDFRQERVGNRKVLLAREAPDEPYRVYHDTVASSILNLGTIGGITGIAMSPATGGMTGLAGMTALGTGLGEFGEFAVDKARGFEQDTLVTGLVNSTLMGGFAGSIDLATMGVGRLARLSRNIPRTPGAQTTTQAQQVAQNKRLPRPMVGQVTKVPLVPQLLRQAAAVSPRVTEKFEVNEQEMLLRLREMTDTDFESLSDDALDGLLDVQRKEMQHLIAGRTLPTSTKDELGTTFQEAAKRYEQVSRRAKNRLYTKAKKIGTDLEFNISRGVQTAQDKLSGIRTRARGGGEQEIPPNFTPKFRRIVERIANSDSVIRTFTDSKGVEQSSIDQLIGLRTSLFDFMQDGTPSERAVARELWTHLRGAMENPVAGNKRGRDLLLRANKANAIREANLETTAIARALKNDEPAKLISYFGPGNQQAIRTIKNIAGKEWQDLRDDFLGHLTENPESGLSLIRSLRKDKGTLREIMTESEEEALTKYLKAARRLDTSTLAKVSEGYMSRAERARSLAREGKERISEHIRLTGGSNAQFAEDARRGILREAVDKATVAGTDVAQHIDPGLLQIELNNILKDDGLSPLFTKQWRSEVEDLMAYLGRTKRAPDFGSNLYGAGLAADLKSFGRAIFGMTGAAVNVTLGGLLTRPSTFKRAAQAEGLIDEKLLRAATQTATRIENDAERFDEDAESATVQIFEQQLLGEGNGE